MVKPWKMNKDFRRCLLIGVALVALCSHRNVIDQKTECNYYYDTLLRERIYTKVSIQPQYNDEKGQVIGFIRKKLSVTETDLLENSEKIVLAFIISSDGRMQQVRVDNKAETKYTSLEKKMVLMLRSMSKWTPGECNGIKVSTLVRLPIIF